MVSLRILLFAIWSLALVASTGGTRLYHKGQAGCIGIITLQLAAYNYGIISAQELPPELAGSEDEDSNKDEGGDEDSKKDESGDEDSEEDESEDEDDGSKSELFKELSESSSSSEEDGKTSVDITIDMADTADALSRLFGSKEEHHDTEHKGHHKKYEKNKKPEGHKKYPKKHPKKQHPKKQRPEKPPKKRLEKPPKKPGQRRPRRTRRGRKG